MSNFSKFEYFNPTNEESKKYTLNAPVIWDIGAKGSEWKLIIPTDTQFDISVPRLLEWAQNPHDRRVLLAAAIHDELLKQGFDPAFAASEFRRAAIARGVSKFRAWVLFFVTLVWTSLKS